VRRPPHLFPLESQKKYSVPPISFRRGRAPQAKSLLSKAKVMLERAGSEPGKDDKSELDWLAQELTKVSE
jgi:hypothetical protein